MSQPRDTLQATARITPGAVTGPQEASVVMTGAKPEVAIDRAVGTAPIHPPALPQEDVTGLEKKLQEASLLEREALEKQMQADSVKRSAAAELLAIEERIAAQARREAEARESNVARERSEAQRAADIAARAKAEELASAQAAAAARNEIAQADALVKCVANTSTLLVFICTPQLTSCGTRARACAGLRKRRRRRRRERWQSWSCAASRWAWRVLPPPRELLTLSPARRPTRRKQPSHATRS